MSTRSMTRSAARRGRGRHACAITGAALLMLAANGAPAWAEDADSAEKDAQLVYCLAPAHRADLLAAAVRLGLLKANGRVDPVRWAEDRKDDFGRACAALMAAESDSPALAAQDKGTEEDGWFLALVKQLPLLLAGALLTVGGQAYERGSSERRLVKQELRAAEIAYRGAVQEYLAEYRRDARADHRAVRTARDELAAALSRVSGLSPRRKAAQRLADGLPLADPLPRTDGQYLLDSEALVRNADGEHASVERCLRTIPELNRTSLYWSWHIVRNRPVRSRTARGAE